MRHLRAALALAGWALLGVAALAGVLLSLLALLAASDLGRPVVASAAVRIVDEAVAGSLELKGVEVLPAGGVELRGLRVLDPDGHLVLEVDRARVFADATRLRNRVLGLRVEVEGASVLLEEEAGGGLSIARAFAPSRPSPPRPPGRAAPPRAGPGWRLRFERVTVRRGEVWWVDAAGATRLEAQGIDLDARGVLGPERSRAEVSLRGALDAPLSGPVALQARAALEGSALRVAVLRARVGDTTADLLGEVDLRRLSGRAAVVRLAVEQGQVRALAPRAAPGGDLAATAFAESDGAVATAAVHVEPARAGAAPGGGDAAVAVRVGGARAAGVEVSLDRLDPSRVHARAPRGEVSLTARGGAAGQSLEALRGRVTVSLERSRLRGAELGPGRLQARVDAGRWEVQRLSLAAPGLSAEGSGSWRRAGAVSGRVAVEAADLGRALRNVEAFLGTPLPPLAGRGRVAGTLAGTAAQPVLDASVEAPLLQVGGLAFAGVRAEAHLAGPLRTVAARVDGSAERLRQGRREVARALFVRGTIDRAEARLDASADVPALGRDPVTLALLAERTPRPDEVVLTELALAYPGTRYALVRPARVRLSAPRVDRLELAAGPQRIALEGGVGERGALDARLQVEALRLEGLPAGLLPPGERLAGIASAEVTASGTTRRPELVGRVTLADARWRALEGLRAIADLRWDGAARRAAASAGVARAEGGTADVAFDLPLPLAGRPGEPVSARVRGEGLPLAALLAAARLDVPATGALSVEAQLSGVVGAPSLRAEATLADASYQDLSSVALAAAADAPGERVRLQAEARLDGERALVASAELPLDLSDLLTRPAEALRGLPTAPVTADAELPGLELARLADRLGLPEDLAGRLAGRAHLEGTLSAPRGAVALELAGGAAAGYSGLGAHLELDATAERVAARARASLRDQEVLQATASLGAPPERLAGRAGLRAAPLALEAVVPRVELARTAAAEVLLGGTVEGRLAARGTLAAPEASLELAGKGVTVEGRPLGDVAARAGWAGRRGTAEVSLAAAPGGTLDASLAVEAPLSVDLRWAALREAPAALAVRARALDLGVVAALVPGLVRTASGKLEADVAARDPLGRLWPRGTVRIDQGRVAVSEYGDWTEIALEASVTGDAVEISRLAAHRGHGKLEARGSLTGLARADGKLEGRVTTQGLTLMRAGVDFATLDLQVDARGTYRPGTLQVDLTVPRGTVRLPKRTPRTLQSLERRPDITVGRRPPRKTGLAALPRPPGAGEQPLSVTVHAVAPGRFMVVSDNPRTRIELKADVTLELEGGLQTATGTVEVVRGEVEPLGGKTFQIERGKVRFTGGPPRAAMLDVVATYKNPAALVTATIEGPLAHPEFHLTSEPQMPEGQIALLIATGRTELKPGAGGVGTLTGEEAGKALAGAIATQAFKDLLADKLPLDTVALESGALRAGKYVTDQIYVTYVRRYDTQLEQGQNQNEVRVEYQISRRWTFESRYGDAQSGGASLIWSKDY